MSEQRVEQRVIDWQQSGSAAEDEHRALNWLRQEIGWCTWLFPPATLDLLATALLIWQAFDEAESFEELTRLHERLLRASTGEQDDTFVGTRLARLAAEGSLEQGPLDEAFAAAKWDLSGDSIDTPASLIQYCDLWGGSLCVWILPHLLDDRQPTIESAARELGMALRLTRIVSTIGACRESTARVRVPVSEVERYGVDPLTETAPVSAPYRLLLESIMVQAEDRFASALRASRSLPISVRHGVRSLIRIRRERLNRVRELDYAPQSDPLQDSRFRQIECMLHDGYDRRMERLFS